MGRRGFAILLAVACALVAASAPAVHAAERWVKPAGGLASGECEETAPCTLPYAVASSDPNDEVVVPYAEYLLGAPLAVNHPLTIRGVAGEAHPLIIGSFTAPTISLDAGGALRHVGVGQLAGGQVAVRIRGGEIEDFAARSKFGVALDAGAGTSGLLVRDAIVVTDSADTSAAVAVSGTGSTKLLNLTVWATGGGTGIDCGVAAGGSVSIVNTLVRGVAADIASPGSNRCQARNSNFRPSFSTGIGASSTNQAAAPVLHDTTQNFRPRPTSPTIDAGAHDLDLTSNDPDGSPRVIGSVPDIGAYEVEKGEPGTDKVLPPKANPKPVVDAPPLATLPTPAEPAAEPRAADQAPAAAAAPPVLGKRVVLDAAEGEVLVKAPGRKGFVKLADAANLPVGTVIDTRNGAVTLQASLGGGKAQTGTFSGGLFTVRQDPKGKGMTDLFLTGGSRAGCGKAARRRTTAKAAGHGRKTVRRLWGEDRSGRFRTHGSKSVATVRGTRWLTEDRCDGTYTKVTEGAVDVKSKRTGKTTRVRAGGSLLVR